MYFWRIELLKRELRRRPLGQRAAFAYVVATLLLYTSTSAMPISWNTEPVAVSTTDWVSYALMIVFVGGGTYAAYRANGGQAGFDFTSRYFALSWVLFIRLLVLVFVPAFFLLFGVMVATAFLWPEGDSSDMVLDWSIAVVIVAFEAVYYWRLVHHLKQVATSGLARADSGSQMVTMD
jgi:hypothetical protein